MRHAEMLIAGHFLGGPCDQSTGKSVMRSPWNGRVVGAAAEGGPREVEASIQAAQEAFATWRTSRTDERAELLSRIAVLVRERRQDLAEILVEEIGKPITWALGEVDRMAITFDLSALAAQAAIPVPHDLDYDPRGRDYDAEYRREPLGPVLCIVPYNWPFNLAAHKIGPALAGGNTVVLKPSGLAPLATLSLARLIHEAGCPAGVLNAIHVSGPLAEKAAQDPRIKKVSFTGSPAVGWRLKQLLPNKRVTLELGGNASAIVLDDADLDWAAQRIASSAYGYAGQVCISAQHVWATPGIYDELKQGLVHATENCPVGDPALPDTVCGPLIHAEAAAKVVSWTEEASAVGAKVLAGGLQEGNLVTPTLVEDVPANVRLGCEEVFGPVLTLGKVSTLDEAIDRANASKFGIHASVFSHDAAAAESAIVRLEVGGVVLNDFPTLRFDGLPYGGVKESGFGREGVPYAFDEMTELKAVVRRLPSTP
jgi:acyl-CoA reductase-like NAD-dependent aldehyde dehydrogenase